MQHDQRTQSQASAAGPDPEIEGSPRRAAVLSFLWPGLGQLYLGRVRSALLYAVPPLVVAVAVAVAAADGLQILAARLFSPSVALTALAAIVLLALWRVISIFDARRAGLHGKAGTGRSLFLAVALSGLVVACHGYMGWFAWSFYHTGQEISEPVGVASPSPPPTLAPGATATPVPLPGPTTGPPPSFADGLLNVLIVGSDTGAGGTHNTDTMLVASFDPRSKKIVMLSLPRDTAQVPMPDGSVWPNKINGLLAYADNHPEEFPAGGMGTLLREIEFLVGVPVPYYVSVDIAGFRELVDAVGGVDVTIDRTISDPTYQFTPDRVGFHLEPGTHHLDGALATAFARSRRGAGGSDFARARRQQQLILALRNRMNDPAVIANLPNVLEVVGRVVRTNVPLDNLAQLIELGELSQGAEPRHIVLGPRRFSERIPPAEINGLYALRLKMDEVAALSIELFGSESRYAEGSPAP